MHGPSPLVAERIYTRNGSPTIHSKLGILFVSFFLLLPLFSVLSYWIVSLFLLSILWVYPIFSHFCNCNQCWFSPRNNIETLNYCKYNFLLFFWVCVWLCILRSMHNPCIDLVALSSRKTLGSSESEMDYCDGKIWVHCF